MARPVWITPTGSLGVIPEGVFYQQALRAYTEPLANRPICTATSATTNLITCDSTAGMYASLQIEFVGTTFGGLSEHTRYFVHEVVSSTQFSISDTEFDTSPRTLTTGSGSMTAVLSQHVYYNLIAGTLPKGIQVADNGTLIGVPQAVASLQGVPTEVAQDVVSKFAIRGYTKTQAGAVDSISDRTFTLTVTGNDVPEFLTPAGAFLNTAPAEFVGAISGTTLTVSGTPPVVGTIIPGMTLQGNGVYPGTVIRSYISGSGSTGTYLLNIPQTLSSVSMVGRIGNYYDGDYVELPIQYTNTDPGDEVTVTLIAGELPLGLTIDSAGVIKGFIRPAPNEDEPVGYDETPAGTVPYDFVSSAISKNYQFTLEVSDGKSSSIRTFTMFVYNRDDLTADDTYITADNTFVTADQTPERFPFLLNFEPGDLGRVRSDNYFAYRFIGQDYDNEPVRYAFSVNQGFGSPPGLELDPASGWYYGFIPDQGVTELQYSFNITVYQESFVGTAINCTATTSGTNVITCDSTLQLAVGQPIVFTGTGLGGLSADPTTIYYVADVFGSLGSTQFKVSTSPISTTPVALTTSSGVMQANLVVASAPYPFDITITGDIDSEVTWLSPAYLGEIDNGSTSMFRVEAENTGGRTLSYRLKDGAFNELPQGLKLLPSGEIAGRVTFNTFAIDLGSTTFDATQNNIINTDPTTFDSTFVFTVNAYAEDSLQPLYNLSEVIVEDGGTGYSSAPTITLDAPTGATAEIAVVEAEVSAGAITAVNVIDSGAGYTTDNPNLTIIGAGSGAVLQPVMQQTGSRDIISVFKTFTIKVVREYNKPYQNLFVLAMPPQNDRVLLNQLLTNEDIFIPELIYRPDDPNFGLSTQVKYQHAFGLAPDTFETYVSSLYENHYWKNLTLGAIRTAQAIDPVSGEVVYEVVYSQVVDNLVNDAGESVSKIVNLPYSIIDPADGSTVINNVYPNSLVNMRDQVIDVVGQISTKLPLWMTSKQTNGRVLGFTPAWVICYTIPGEAARIAYYIDSQFGEQLNRVDFKVDRYVLDSTLSKNWDAENQQWTPTPSQTTFDRVDTLGYADLGIVDACTELAFADVNLRPIEYINSLGGLDGSTWVSTPGQTPPVGTKVVIENGSKIIFVKQESFIGPSGSVFDTAADAFTNYLDPYDDTSFDSGTEVGGPATFDYGPVISGGYSQECTATVASTDTIRCNSTLGMTVGDKVWFTGTPFGGVSATTNGFVQLYYVADVTDVTCTATTSGTNLITTTGVSDINDLIAVGDQVWFTANQVTGTATTTEATGNLITCDNVTNMKIGQDIVFSGTSFGNIVPGATYYVKTINVTTKKITISNSPTLSSTFTVTDDTGNMTFIASSIFGNINEFEASGLPQGYYVVDIPNTTQFAISDTAGGAPISLSTGSGAMVMYVGQFQISTTPGGSTVALSNDTGSMFANYGNQRMAIYTVNIGSDGLLRLTLDTQTIQDDYVTSSQGQKYTTGTYLYRPGEPQQDLTLINWQPLITATTVVTGETLFDGGSIAWVDPVDMYDTSDSLDKYLVFPRANILV